jgi:catechol 2,3-dioxygenase
MNQLPAETTIGAVHLITADLGPMIQFYTEIIGFRIHRQDARTAALGAGDADLLVLEERPESRPVSGTTGLYHFAILVPSRRHLALSLQHLIDTDTAVQGFADHLVSEAIYLADPEGNGIEIYRDRPRETWPFSGNQMLIGTEPLDLSGVLGELKGESGAWLGLAPHTRIGHIHLHVADLDRAEKFYTQTVGFDLIMRLGHSAGFASAGGYHHHLGFNTWAGVGAPRPPADATGLDHFEVLLPSAASRDEVVAQVEAAGFGVSHQADGALVEDPSGNRIMLRQAIQAG